MVSVEDIERSVGDVRRRVRASVTDVHRRVLVALGLLGHTIVCGTGSTGRHVIEELIATRTKFVAIDVDEERIRDLVEHHPGVTIPYVVGDATADLVLREAGLERAKGLVAALREDKDNL